MKITKHSQSCFLIESSYSKILIDPGKFVFEDEGLLPDAFQGISVIIITHLHTDHFDLENIIKIFHKSHPIFFTTTEVRSVIIKSIPNADIRILGSTKAEKIEDFLISGVNSIHGPLPSGQEPPIVSGVLIDDGETKFYHPGDTIVLEEGIEADVLATPICGQVVMSIQEAKSQLVMLKPKIVIPMHYDNPKYPVEIGDFIKAMDGTGIEIRTLKNGEVFES